MSNDLIKSSQPSTDPPAASTHRRRWLVLGAVVVLVGAAGISAKAVSSRYLDAVPLSTDGGGWIPPDNLLHLRHIQAGQYDSAVVPPRPGHSQTFELDLNNESDVSQTVLGLTDGEELGNPRDKAEPVHLTISRSAVWPQRGPVRYTSDPVTIPPKGQYELRFTIDTGPYWRGQPCRSEYWRSLSLQVRVGIFTRTETLDFGDLIMELRAPGKGC